MFFEQGYDFIPLLTLDDDFSVFGGAAYAAFVFQVAGESFQVLLGANESLHERDYLAFALFLVDTDPELLLLGRLGCRFFLSGVFVLEIRVGGVNHVDAFFFVCHDD